MAVGAGKFANRRDAQLQIESRIPADDDFDGVHEIERKNNDKCKTRAHGCRSASDEHKARYRS